MREPATDATPLVGAVLAFLAAALLLPPGSFGPRAVEPEAAAEEPGTRGTHTAWVWLEAPGILHVARAEFTAPRPNGMDLTTSEPWMRDEAYVALRMAWRQIHQEGGGVITNHEPPPPEVWRNAEVVVTVERSVPARDVRLVLDAFCSRAPRPARVVFRATR